MSANIIGRAVEAGKEAVEAQKEKLAEGWEEYPADTGKAGQVSCCCAASVPSDSPYYNRLASDLANSYYWTGGPLTDYAFYVANWHPFLGMFFCHPNHPWSKLERFAMFVISAFITLVPSVAIGVNYPPDGTLLRSGVKTVLIILFVTIPDILAGVFLYQLSVADARCPNLCGTCLNCAKRCAIVWIFSLAAIATGVSFVILDEHETNWTALLEPLIEGKVISYLTWFPLKLLLPCQLGYISKWTHESSEASKAEAKEPESQTQE